MHRSLKREVGIPFAYKIENILALFSRNIMWVTDIRLSSGHAKK